MAFKNRLLFAALPTLLIFPNDIFFNFSKQHFVTQHFILLPEILGTDVSENVA